MSATVYINYQVFLYIDSRYVKLSNEYTSVVCLFVFKHDTFIEPKSCHAVVRFFNNLSTIRLFKYFCSCCLCLLVASISIRVVSRLSDTNQLQNKHPGPESATVDKRCKLFNLDLVDSKWHKRKSVMTVLISSQYQIWVSFYCTVCLTVKFALYICQDNTNITFHHTVYNVTFFMVWSNTCIQKYTIFIISHPSTYSIRWAPVDTLRGVVGSTDTFLATNYICFCFYAIYVCFSSVLCTTHIYDNIKHLIFRLFLFHLYWIKYTVCTT